MRILACTGEAATWSSSQLAIRTLKKLGHDVVTIGGFEGADKPILPKRPWPEKYQYSEVKSIAGDDYDLVLQLEPGFWLQGNNTFKCKSAVWISDIHRGGMAFRDLIVSGNFDYVFISMKYYSPHFQIKGIEPIWMPIGYDSDRVKNYDVAPECDIVFNAETGIHERYLTPDKVDSDGYTYLDKLPENWEFMSEHEYQERATIISRLMKDFDVRIYRGGFYGEDYAKTLQKGRLTFNRTAQYDASFKNFELAAVYRPFITNWVPTIDELHLGAYIYFPYYSYKLPHLFDLDYEQIKDLVILSLSHDEDEIDRRGRVYSKYVEDNYSMKTMINRILLWVTDKDSAYWRKDVLYDFNV